MRILNLIIKQKYFNEILSGKKTEEYREVRPTTFKKYLRYVVNDKEYDSLDDPDLKPLGDDFEFDVVPIEYDALRLFVGYNRDRDSMLVKVNGTVLETFVDENDEPIYYEHNGTEYIMSQIIYQLGEIIETDIHPKG